MPLLLLVAFWSVLGFSLQASDIALAKSGDVWRYFKGVTEPSPTPGAWKEPGFPDANWLIGTAGFSSIQGYPEPTVLPDFGLGYRSAYFRRRFQLEQPERVRWLTLRIDYEHGFIAYLNGAEIARRNVPGVPGDLAPFDATTGYAPHGATTEIDVTAAIPQLRSGENVLAIHLVGSLLSSGCWLTPELFANLSRAPFVQNVATNAATIHWKTFRSLTGFIDFGLTPETAQRIPTAPGLTNHAATLRNLAPDTEYAYRVGATDGVGEALSDWGRFRTFKMNGSTRFAVLGDTGWGLLAQFQVAAQIRAIQPDFVMHTGDVIYHTYTPHLEDSRFFSVYSGLTRSVPFYLAFGNHDAFAARTYIQTSWALPTNSVTGTEDFYAFEHGEALMVAVWTDAFGGADFRPGSLQYTWLEQVLSTTTRPWKFLFFHHPLQSSSLHIDDDYNADGVLDNLLLLATIGELATRHGAQIIFNSHDHLYERYAPLRGWVNIISGGGGAALYPVTDYNPISVRNDVRHHFVKVEVDADEAVVSAVDTGGLVFDTMHLRRTWPARLGNVAAWRPIVPELAPLPDGDGNRFGQQFVYGGSPVSPVPGKLSSAGRLFVNYDRDFVYFGFDETALVPGQTLYLFAGKAGGDGVASLRGLGNGTVDPEGEGVDGLDFLETLSFTNFAPSVGAVLGDEHADFMTRSFLRTGAVINVGQGAFFLQPGLPEVAGQKLQQFARSPQLAMNLWEQNANYIDLAIPWAAFGGWSPTDRLQVAAVVGLAGTNAAAPEIDLDVGGVAASFQKSGETWWLEALEFQLASEDDQDGDGVPAEQERGIGTNPNDPDTDRDGLPDGWEIRFQTSPLSAAGVHGPAGDPDGDGLNNQAEFRAGTDPRNPSSALALRVAELPSGTLTLAWRAVPGKRYMLEQSARVTGPYSDVPDVSFPRLAASNEETFEMVRTASDPEVRFYRIRLLPAP